MTHDKVSISKSKQKGQVVRDSWLFFRLRDLFVQVVFVGLLPFMALNFLFIQLKQKESLFSASIFLIISLILGAIFLYSILDLNKLKRIKGVKKDKNMKIIKNWAETHNWQLEIHNQDISVLTCNNWFSTAFKKELVVLYHKEEILTNSICYGLFDMKSPFHYFTNKKLISELESLFVKP